MSGTVVDTASGGSVTAVDMVFMSMAAFKTIVESQAGDLDLQIKVR